MKKLVYPVVILFILTSCNSGDKEPDAWGNFESNEIIISAENNGKILKMNVHEGDILSE